MSVVTQMMVSSATPELVELGHDRADDVVEYCFDARLAEIVQLFSELIMSMYLSDRCVKTCMREGLTQAEEGLALCPPLAA